MGGGEVCTLMGDPKYEDVVRQVRGWILECPFIGFTPEAEPSNLKVVVGRFISRFLPTFQLKHTIPPEHLSRDPAVVEDIRNDPLCHDTGTLEGLASLLDRTILLASGTAKVPKYVRSLLLAHATDDKTCNYDTAMKWLDQQDNVEDKTGKGYEGAYHQLHDDLCRDEFEADLVDWILKRSGPQGEAPVEAKL